MYPYHDLNQDSAKKHSARSSIPRFGVCRDKACIRRDKVGDFVRYLLDFMSD